MPTIRHRTGPLAGKEQTFDPRVERITFGRDPSVCDVVFPPDLTLISRKHFALRRSPSDEWMYEDFGNPYVGVNGRPAETDEAIPSGAIVELGKPGGPSFEVIFEGKAATPGLADTIGGYKAESAREAAAKAAAKARKVGIGAGAAVLVLAIGLGVVWWTSASQASKLNEAYAASQKRYTELAARSIGQDVSDNLEKAAHVVVIQFASGQYVAQGTASPIGPDLFVTNAHVAELREKLGAGDKLLVRAPGKGGKVYEVVEHKLHPGYRAFNQYLKDDPIFVTSAKACPTCFPSLLSASLSYDVALLKVAPGSNAGPVLQLASPEELQAMRPGMPIALAGYPLEAIRGSEIQGVTATPNYRAGVISAMTDMFNMPGDVAQRRLIHHNIPVTGGNSGSPMVNAQGKLVALLNSGNMLKHGDSGRMPNAAVVNYGQRADLVHELVNGTAEANLAAERAYWAKQTETFQRGRQFIVDMILKQTRPANQSANASAASDKPEKEVSRTLSTGDSFKAKEADGKEVARRQQIHQFELKGKIPGILPFRLTLWIF
jgi:V8-like Glu-specific endopeptidase